MGDVIIQLRDPKLRTTKKKVQSTSYGKEIDTKYRIGSEIASEFFLRFFCFFSLIDKKNCVDSL